MYTITTIAVSSSSLLSGAIITKWGHFSCSLISLFLTTIGFLFLALININQTFLFPGYLLISTAGFLSHLMNVQIPRTIPKWTVILMTTFAGLYSASSSSFLAIQYFHDLGFSLNTIFSALGVLTILLKVPRIMFLTPHHLPQKVESEYSLYSRRALCNRQEVMQEDQTEPTTDASLKAILRDPMIYFICIGYSAFSLRSLTFAGKLNPPIDKNYTNFKLGWAQAGPPGSEASISKSRSTISKNMQISPCLGSLSFLVS